VTVDEFLAWVPPDQWGCWELIDGKPRWRMRPLRETDVVATTPEELAQLLDAREGGHCRARGAATRRFHLAAPPHACAVCGPPGVAAQGEDGG
jgi:hypothetical protein